MEVIRNQRDGKGGKVTLHQPGNFRQTPNTRLADTPVARCVELWLQDNQAALESSNAFVERNGLQLAKLRGC
jgi:hypothetical protein